MSKPRESHPQLLAEPNVNLSAHRAPIDQTIPTIKARRPIQSSHPTHWYHIAYDKSSSSFKLAYISGLINPTPLLHTHYRHIIATTSRSATVSCIGTLGLAFLHLAVSLNITITASRSSTKAPRSESRPLYAGHRLPGKQVSCRLVPEADVSSGFDDVY